MASIAARLGITESAPVQMIRGLRRIAQDLTVDYGTVLAYADERYRAASEIAQAWAWYEANVEQAHVQPHELAYADLNSDWLADGDDAGLDEAAS